MKLANPFYYPVAMLVGGMALVLGVRLWGLPKAVMIPAAATVATLGATFLKAREPQPEKMARREMELELQEIQNLARGMAKKADLLRQEAEEILTRGDFQLDLLVAVQSVCDRLSFLPNKIEQLSQKISDKEALLSLDELEMQLTEAQKKLPNTSGIARQHLEQLINSLEKNINLAKTGKDARQAQIFNLHNLIQNSGGILQEMQNKLRTSNLELSQNLAELQDLSNELNQYQENVDILIN